MDSINTEAGQEETKRIYEAEVAQELRRRRRVMTMYIGALVIPLFAAGLALKYSKSDQEQYTQQLTSAVHEQVCANLPSTLESILTPRIDSAIERKVAKTVAGQTALMADYVQQRELASAGSPAHKSYVDVIPMSARALPVPLIELSAADSLRHDINASAIQLAAIEAKIAVIEGRQIYLQQWVDSLIRTHASANTKALNGVKQELRSLTPKKLRQQARILRKGDKKVGTLFAPAR